MRPGSNARRTRGRSHRRQGGGPNKNQTFDSNGPEGRVRGNATQVYEKYVALGRDAYSSGDRVQAEAFFQHAEHYFRILNDSTDPESENRESRQERSNGHGDSQGESDGRGQGGQGGQGDSQPSRKRGDDDRPEAQAKHDGDSKKDAEAKQDGNAKKDGDSKQDAQAKHDGDSKKDAESKQDGGGPPRKRRKPRQDDQGQSKKAANGDGGANGHDGAGEESGEGSKESAESKSAETPTNGGA